MGKDKKNIEVISGNGKDLDISPVSTHIPVSKPKIKSNNNEDIVIPTEKKKRKNK